MNAILPHWGFEIRQRREAALISQGELARRADISQAMVSRIENHGVGATDETKARIEAALVAAESDEEHAAEVRRRALAKLSAVEQRALGLEAA